ncbi:MAG: Ig-like domain-containing protein, partial [Solirubrobacterales bacterium]
SIFPGESVLLTFTSTSPSTNGTYPWAAQVKQSNDFNGTNNDFSLAPGASAASTTVTTASCNKPPVVTTSSGTTAYTENGAATAIDTGLTVTDADDTNLESASVQITGNLASGEDVLSFTNTANITGTWTSSTGTLALSGHDTVANYQAALRSVGYSNSSDNPSMATRTVTFKVNDGDVNSAGATKDVSVAAVNDPPVAVDDSTSITLPATLTGFDVVANDTDLDTPNASLAISASDSTSAQGGTVTCAVGGRTCSYTPASGFSGSDSFQYTVTDGSSTATATVKIYVANGTLDCGTGNTADATGSGDLADVHITRLANTDPLSTCVAKNYALTTKVEDPPGPDGPTNVVTFDQQAISGQASAHYLMRIIWTYDPGTSTNTNPSTIGGRTFQIDYGDGTGPHDAQLCTSVTYDGGGNVTGAVHPSNVPWCITGQSYTINSAGKIVLTQSWDGLGDPKVW